MPDPQPHLYYGPYYLIDCAIALLATDLAISRLPPNRPAPAYDDVRQARRQMQIRDLV